MTTEFSLEMLPLVSGISGTDFLSFFPAQRYAAYVIDRRNGTLESIADIHSFIEGYAP